MADEVDRLEIAVDVAAKNANRSLTALEQRIGKIADHLEKILPLTSAIDNLGNFDISGLKKAQDQIDAIFDAERKISKQQAKPRVDRSDLKYTKKDLDDIFDEFKDVGRNIDLSDLGLKELQAGLRMSESAAKRLNERLEKKTAIDGTEELGKSWESLVYDIQRATNQVEIYSDAIGKAKRNMPDFTITRNGETYKPNDFDGITDSSIQDLLESYKDIGKDIELPDFKNKEEILSFIEKYESEMDKAWDTASRATSSIDLDNAIREFSIYSNYIEKARSAYSEFVNLPGVDSSKTKEATNRLYTYDALIKEVKSDLSDLANKGLGEGDAEYDEKVKLLKQLQIEQKRYNKEQEKAAKAELGIKETDNSLRSIRKNLSQTSAELSKFAKNASKAFRNAWKGAERLAASILGLRRQSNRGMSFGRMLGSSVLFSFVFQGISAVQNAIKEGSDNLVQYSDTYNQSISSIVSSLTYLKNAWAAAFSPIVNVVAPYLSSFIDMLASALNSVGQFLAALTGKGFAVQAKKVMQDYGASLADTSSNAKDAADAMKDLESYTLGIDELNIIQPQSTSGGGAGNGGSGGASEISPSEMFETVKVEGALSDFAKRIREAFLSEDWEGLGAILADGVNTGLQKLYDVINWNNVGPKITKFANAFTTTFNSLVDNINWTLMGNTVGAGINTVVNTANLFIEGINWKNLGISFGTGIMGIADEVNWINLGRLIGNKFMIAWDIFLGLVLTLNWGEVGRSLADGFNGMLQTISLGDIGTTIGTIVAGIIDLFREFFSNADWGEVANQIKEGISNALSAASNGGENNGILAVLFGAGGAIEISKKFDPLLTAINTVKEALSGINFTQVFSGITGPVAGLAGAISLLAVGLGIVFATNEDVRNSFSKAASTISENFQPVMELITDDILPDLRNGWNKLKKILERFGNFLNTGFTDVWQKFINPALEYLGNTILPDVISTFKNLWKNVLVPLGNLIGDVFTPVIEFVSYILEKLWKNVVSPLAESLKGPLSRAFNFVYSVLNSTVIPIVNTVIDIFQFLWNNVLSPIVNFLKSTFGPIFEKIFGKISTLIDNLGKHFETLIDGINKALGLLKNAVNGIIDGINWVAKRLGLGDVLDHWDGVKLANGTSGLPKDTIAMVNDQKGPTYREMIFPPNGKPFIPSGRNVTLPLQKGTKVMPANLTKDFLELSKVPHFASGIGDFFSGAWEKAKDIAGSIWDYVKNPEKIVQIAINKFVDVSSIFEPWSTITGGIIKKLMNGIVSKVKGLFDEAIPEVNYSPSAGVEQWRDLARKALQMTNQYTEANLNRLLMQMQTESGGNPNAINNWDINAKNGTPSKGLMQVIDPTFKTWAMDGYDTNIWDPLSNMLASIRYTVNRYGSLANGWKGHGYESGIGKITLSDLSNVIPFLAGGGVLNTGQMFVARERGPELVGSYGRRTTVMNNDQIVQAVSNGVATAVDSAAALILNKMEEMQEVQEQIRDKKNVNNIDGKRADKLISRARKNSGYSFSAT